MKKYIIYSFILSVFFLAACSNDSDESSEGTPGKTTLVFPEKNKQCEVGSVLDDVSTIVFEWKNAGDTETYDLTIVNLETDKTIDLFGIEETKKSVSLERGYPYAWNVTSRNDLEIFSVSDTWKFYLAGQGAVNNAPVSPKAVSPGLGWLVTPQEGKIVLQWEATDPDNDALVYTVYIDKIDGKQAPLTSNTNLSENSVAVAVEPNTIYYWSVEASDGRINVVSDVFSFKTE
jgi:hypothetical protein